MKTKINFEGHMRSLLCLKIFFSPRYIFCITSNLFMTADIIKIIFLLIKWSMATKVMEGFISYIHISTDFDKKKSMNVYFIRLI